MKDKQTLWRNAEADEDSAERSADIAGGAAGAACAFAFVSLGIGGAACAATIANLAHAMSKAEEARDKEDIAFDAYNDAVKEWFTCVTKMPWPFS